MNSSVNTNPVRGRPGKIPPSKIKETILKYKSIINNNNNIISKTNDIWNVIAQELENKVTSNNLYVFTMCNRYAIKNVILNKDACNDKSVFVSESMLSDTFNWSEKSVNCSPNANDDKKHLTISLLREDFTNLLENRETDNNDSAIFEIEN